MTTIVTTGFHAHIYFDLAQRPLAEALRERALADLAEVAQVFPLVPRNVGPHLKPMFEIDFEPAHRATVCRWLEAHHGALSVLIHAVTGNDWRDHTELATWLGTPLPLDMTRLDP